MIKHLLTAAALLIASPSWACEPCEETLTLDKTIAQARFVAVAERITPQTEDEKKQAGGPDFIELMLKQVLKGDKLLEISDKADTLKVRAWSGHCPFGLVIPQGEENIVFLDVDIENPGSFRVIEYGCSVKSLPLRNGNVVTPEGNVTLAEFKKRLL